MRLQKALYIGRHGLRAPIVIPKRYEKDWPAKGFLTAKGAEAQYSKGLKIREKNLEFFEALSNSRNNITVSTSNLCRTIASAYHFLYGIRGLPLAQPFSVGREQMIAELKAFGATFKPLAKDVMYRSHYVDVSPSTKDIYQTLLNKSHSGKDYYTQINAVLEKVKDFWEYDKSKPVDYFAAFYLNDFLSCYYAHGRELPEGFDMEILDALKFVHYFFLHDLMFSSEILRRLTNHYLCKKMMENLEHKQVPVFHYYSSHDTNLFALLLGLGYNLKEAPTYSAGLFIKVQEAGGEEYVDLEYEGKSITSDVWKGKGKVKVSELVAKLKKECFESEEDYRKYSGNYNFDYVRDYVEAIEECSETMEEESLRKFKLA